MTSGQVVTVALGVTLFTVEQIAQIACICGMNRADCDTDTNVCISHFYSYHIHSVRLANRKSKMAAISEDGHGQINVDL